MSKAISVGLKSSSVPTLFITRVGDPLGIFDGDDDGTFEGDALGFEDGSFEILGEADGAGVPVKVGKSVSKGGGLGLGREDLDDRVERETDRVDDWVADPDVAPLPFPDDLLLFLGLRPGLDPFPGPLLDFDLLLEEEDPLPRFLLSSKILCLRRRFLAS